MAGVGVWGGDTFIRKFLLGNLPSTLNTSVFKYLTCKCNYLSALASLSRESGRTQELWGCDLGACPAGLGSEGRRAPAGVGWDRKQARKQGVASVLRLYMFGAQERLLKHGHERSITAFRRVSPIVS